MSNLLLFIYFRGTFLCDLLWVLLSSAMRRLVTWQLVINVEGGRLCHYLQGRSISRLLLYVARVTVPQYHWQFTQYRLLSVSEESAQLFPPERCYLSSSLHGIV